MKLYNHQQRLVSLAPKKWLLSWGVGTGKTLAAITLCNNNPLVNVLVICPKSLRDQWLSEIAKYSMEKRLWTVLTKEEFKKQAKDLPKYNRIIVDEFHYFSNYKSQLTKSLIWYIGKHDPEQVYGLTGTPYLSSIWCMYTYGIIFGKVNKKDWWKWNNKYFNQIPMGHRMVPIQKKTVDDIPIELHVKRLINQIGNTVALEDCMDVPEQIFETEYFELTKEQEKAIEELDDLVPISRWTKIHQLCGGTLKGDENKFYKSDKLDRLLELCEQNPKVVVVCRYNNEIQYIKDKMGRKYSKKNIFVIQGRTDNKQDIIDKANQYKEGIVLCNSACSEGYELSSFPIMIFYSYDFSLKNYVQIKGRIQRINAIKKNVYISLVVKGTIDEDVYKCIMSKKDFQVALYEKARS